jgi:choline dehydrogenase-like flavoprotein
MPAYLPRLLPDATARVDLQDTEFTLDVVGRYICSTWDEAVNNGGVALDAVVIGAGMFGAYCAEKIYRHANMRVLVLDAGALLVTEHVQNLARIGLNVPGALKVQFNFQDPGPQERVWGYPWRSQVAFPGLAYCYGGRSLYWGGWSPRLTAADLAQWPQAIRDFVQNAGGTACDPNPMVAAVDEYCETEREIGVVPAADYISGPLYEALKARFSAVKSQVPTLDAIEDAPLAVQAAPPASGLFSFDKYSSAPILTDAIREAAGNPDWQRRLFYVPRAHVTNLQVNNEIVTAIDVSVNGHQRSLPIPSTCRIVLASGTIEATRLALQSFPTPLIGRNLMAHLRTNTVVRIKRSAFDPGLPQQLESAALLVRGSTPKGRYHMQVTAAAILGANSEAAMWRMIPDIDLLDQMLAGESADWIVMTFRGIGEMVGVQSGAAPKVTGSTPSWVDLSDQTDEFGMRRAWVNLVTSADDQALWNTMDSAALTLAQKVAKDDPTLIQYFSGSGWQNTPLPLGNGRDGLGTTHHEAGTMWMGTDPNASVTNLDGRFHHIQNAYVAGPALFPTLGSANPSLTGLSLARRSALAIVRDALGAEPGFVALGSGGLAGWQMAGPGGFMELGGNIIESFGGIGLLWFTRQQFTNFVLRADFRLSSPTDNSGIFIRFPALGTSDPANDWKPAVTQGYEIQIDNTGFNPDTNTFNDPTHKTGAIYALAPSTATMPAVGNWNTFEIEATGTTITVRLNGQQVSQLMGANRSPQGYIGLQNHHPGSAVQFTRLRVKTLP